MKTGEYIGEDGRVYTVTGSISLHRIRVLTENTGQCLYGRQAIHHVAPNHPDWKLARAALDDLDRSNINDSRKLHGL